MTRTRLAQAAPSAVYNALTRTVRVCDTRVGAAVWGRLWNLAWRTYSGPVTTRIHGHRVVVNAGYSYPMLMRRWPTYNDPLVEIVRQAHRACGRPVTVVDVGAAVGDTALLLLDRAADAVGEIHCVDGDAEFFDLLTHNVGGLAGVHLRRAMLSDRSGLEASLTRIHRGTASAQGTTQAAATTLDDLLADVSHVDVLKVDTDGFDGKIIAGATHLLANHRPAVIFEWHPKLYEATGNDWQRPFAFLGAQGYDRFVWFTKFGEFSHTQHGLDEEGVAALARICLDDVGPTLDWHYDVVALHESTAIRVDDVAALRLARERRGGKPRA
jgi:FkbM family methyltransferase